VTGSNQGETMNKKIKRSSNCERFEPWREDELEHYEE
jgi:hypothetical protein